MNDFLMLVLVLISLAVIVLAVFLHETREHLLRLQRSQSELYEHVLAISNDFVEYIESHIDRHR